MKYTLWLTPRQLSYLKDKSLKMNVTRVDEDLIQTEITIKDKYDLLLVYEAARADGFQEGKSYYEMDNGGGFQNSGVHQTDGLSGFRG